MTIRQKLEQYRALKIEVRNLERRISDMQTKKVSSCDIVKMSSPEFPFTEHSSKVIGHAIDKTTLQKVVDTYKDRLEKANRMILEVEAFISSVEDSEMRELLRLRGVCGGGPHEGRRQGRCVSWRTRCVRLRRRVGQAEDRGVGDGKRIMKKAPYNMGPNVYDKRVISHKRHN